MKNTNKLLSIEQIETYRRDGVLVVDNVLSNDEIQMAVDGLHYTLQSKYHIDPNQLLDTGHNMIHASSTNGSGGVLDIYYEIWQIQLIQSNPILFQITTELWDAFYNNNSSSSHNIIYDDNDDTIIEQHNNNQFIIHPYGSFDCTKGYMYMDRIGYRLPTQLAYDIGKKIQSTTTTPNKHNNKQQKVIPIQRSLTPHLDCCPTAMYSSNSTKWRPIQCLVSLSDTIQPNYGGFEAVKGFHSNFDQWVQHRLPTNTLKGMIIPPPCIGEYTHIRPKEDSYIISRMEHIPIKAGSAVFWDNRIPHANSYRHIGTKPRMVAYCSFLPDIPLNRKYVQQQLQYWMKKQYPSGDQWINKNHQQRNITTSESNNPSNDIQNEECCSDTVVTHYGATNDIHHSKKHSVISIESYPHITEALSTTLSRRLAGVESWED